MKLILATMILSLSGCAQLYNSIPSTEHCTNVLYERTNRDIRIEADCVAPPAGGDSLSDLVT